MNTKQRWFMVYGSWWNVIVAVAVAFTINHHPFCEAADQKAGKILITTNAGDTLASVTNGSLQFGSGTFIRWANGTIMSNNPVAGIGTVTNVSGGILTLSGDGTTIGLTTSAMSNALAGTFALVGSGGSVTGVTDTASINLTLSGGQISADLLQTNLSDFNNDVPFLTASDTNDFVKFSQFSASLPITFSSGAIAYSNSFLSGGVYSNAVIRANAQGVITQIVVGSTPLYSVPSEYANATNFLNGRTNYVILSSGSEVVSVSNNTTVGEFAIRDGLGNTLLRMYDPNESGNYSQFFWGTNISADATGTDLIVIGNDTTVGSGDGESVLLGHGGTVGDESVGIGQDIVAGDRSALVGRSANGPQDASGIGYGITVGIGGFAGGWLANAGQYAGAFVEGAIAGDYAIVGGWNATGGVESVVFGRDSYAAGGAAQIGVGTNTTANTFQFRHWQVIDASGLIPAVRIPTNFVSDVGVTNLAAGVSVIINGKLWVGTNDATGGAGGGLGAYWQTWGDPEAFVNSTNIAGFQAYRLSTASHDLPSIGIVTFATNTLHDRYLEWYVEPSNTGRTWATPAFKVDWFADLTNSANAVIPIGGVVIYGVQKASQFGAITNSVTIIYTNTTAINAAASLTPETWSVNSNQLFNGTMFPAYVIRIAPQVLATNVANQSGVWFVKGSGKLGLQ